MVETTRACLTGHSHIPAHAQQQRDLLYEPTDLADFRGNRIIIDAASFLYWVMGDVMAKRDMYYLGDYGPDFVAATRYFIQTFFIDFGIHSTWVHDGSFNPAKAATQLSRRAERAAPAADLSSRLFACLRNAPRTWSTNEPFLTVAKEVSKGLQEMDSWLGDCTGFHDALYVLLDELGAASQQADGPSLTQVRTILEAYIAAQCLEQGPQTLTFWCWIARGSLLISSNTAVGPIPVPVSWCQRAGSPK